MQILSALTEKFVVIAQEATATVSSRFVSGYVEFSGPTIQNPQLDLISLSGAVDNSGFSTLVDTPTAGNQNQIKFVSLFNFDTIEHGYTFCIDSIGTQTEFVFTLQPGDTLFYSDTRGWYVLDSNGNTKVVIVDKKQIVTRINLSGSTDGRPISVAATATPGTVIHLTNSPEIDEIFLWVTNRTGTAATLTLEWGGTGTSDHLCSALSIPANSPAILVADGLLLGNTLRVRAFSGTANALNISGYANRIA